LAILGFEKTLPVFNQHLPVKCLVFPLFMAAEHYQSIETAVRNVEEIVLKVDLFAY
jgi:hypothetical protein